MALRLLEPQAAIWLASSGPYRQNVLKKQSETGPVRLNDVAFTFFLFFLLYFKTVYIVLVINQSLKIPSFLSVMKMPHSLPLTYHLRKVMCTFCSESPSIKLNILEKMGNLNLMIHIPAHSHTDICKVYIQDGLMRTINTGAPKKIGLIFSVLPHICFKTKLNKSLK